MNKRLLSIILALVLLISSVSALASCQKQAGNTAETGAQAQTGTSTETESGSEGGSESETEPPVIEGEFGNGDTVKDAGTQWDEEVFALTENTIDESKAVTKTAAEMLALLSNKDALSAGEVYRVTEPLVLESDHKYYGNLAAIIAEGGIVIKDVHDVVVKEIIIKGDVTVEGSKAVTFFKLDIKGNSVGIMIDENSSDVSLKNCKVYATDIAVSSAADNLLVYRNYYEAKKGLVSTGDDLAIQDSHIIAEELGVSSNGKYGTVRGNTIEVKHDGIGIDFGEGSYNGLIALNVIKDVQFSITVTEGFNCAVILNSAVRILARNNTNLYVIDNKLGGVIELFNNEYLICDGNSFAENGVADKTVDYNNTEYNGDNLHDVNAREEYGANEELLPHTNKDLFIGMERHSKVRDVSMTKSYTFNNYVRRMARKSSVVIVPPGAYTVSNTLTLDSTHSNTTVYAYGVYQEKDSLFSIFEISSGSNISVKGLTLGYTHQSSGQVYVLEKLANQRLRVVTNAGYINDFGASNKEVFATGCDVFFEDSLSPWQSGAGLKFIEKCDDGTMIFEYTGNVKQFTQIDIGGIFTCRLAGDNSRSIYLAGKNIKMKDCVLYGYAAALALVSGGANNENISLERHHNTVHSALEIDQETYEWYRTLEETYGADLEIFVDDQGRYRGGLPRVGSVDATHISGGNIGVNATSCLFESMCDDGSNQRGSSSRLAGYHDNGDGTTTLYFKGTLSKTYYGINIGKDLASATPTMTNIPLAGDRILVYASNGHIAFEGTTLTAGEKIGELPTCSMDHSAGNENCQCHMIHIDENGDCICDDASCAALMHYDLTKDAKCDKCNTKVYTDYNSGDGYDGKGDGKCDITGTVLVDANNDGIDDVDNVPIVTDMAVNAAYNPSTSKLTYDIRYTTTTGKPSVIQYYTYIYGLKVKTDLVNFDAFEGYDFTDNDFFMKEKILFDNLSRNSAGFTFDNVVVQYTRSRGILVKTVDATIKNCTFRDHGMTAVLLSVETTWGESTVPQNITIQGCLFDNTGCIQGYQNNLTQAPIAIQGLGDLSGTVEISEDTLPCKNIRIVGNKFVNIQNNYCITMSAAQNISILNNVFVARPTDTADGKFGKAVYINGCANINISGNTFSEMAKGDVTKAVVGYNYIGLTGSDIVSGDGTRFLPEEKGPMQ